MPHQCSYISGADYYLRKQSGNYALNAYHWLDSSSEPEGRETIRFQSVANGTIQNLTIQPELCELDGAMQCSCDSTGKNVRQEFRLVAPERP